MLQPAQPGAPPQQTPWKLLRASDGKTRIDYGHTTVITDPVAQHTIVLDHLKKEAQVIPMPQPAVPRMGMPQFAMPQFAPPGAPPTAPGAPALNVQDLGKGFIEGHEVDGKRYMIQPPAPPQATPLPQPMALPQAQALANMPAGIKPPSLPQAPPLPQPPPIAAEVWTSTQLKVPVLTKMTGAFGQQNSYCKAAPSAEPHPAMFQIPQDYKPVPPPAPPLPR